MTSHQNRHIPFVKRVGLVAVVALTATSAACGDDDDTANGVGDQGSTPSTTITEVEEAGLDATTTSIEVPAGPLPTVVLVHGAFADASGWLTVADRLTELGFDVVAPANPLRGLDSDAAYLRSFLGTIEGPIVLVGHSYGGMVITNAARDDADITALVYTAAFAPDEGDTVGGLLAQFPGSKLSGDALVLRPFVMPDGTEGAEGYVAPDAFHEVFAGDLSEDEALLLGLTQRPGSSDTLSQPSGPPAWDAIPTFFLVATEDNLIPPAAQSFMAERASAEVVEVAASHLVMMSQPDAVVELIVDAATP